MIVRTVLFLKMLQSSSVTQRGTIFASNAIDVASAKMRTPEVKKGRRASSQKCEERLFMASFDANVSYFVTTHVVVLCLVQLLV